LLIKHNKWKKQNSSSCSCWPNVDQSTQATSTWGWRLYYSSFKIIVLSYNAYKKGVKFMYDAVTGVQTPDNYGCIMADEMVSFRFLKKNWFQI
jgi:hypothetical protein